MYIVGHKMCHFAFDDHDSGVSWSSSTLFVAVETGMNTEELQNLQLHIIYVSTLPGKGNNNIEHPTL